MSSKRWLLNLDHQFQMSCGFGLSFFKKTDSWKKTMWRLWPHLSCAMDCGPDGMCASFALEHGWEFNFDGVPDPSHGTNCDFNGGLKAVGLMGLILCMMISWNLPYKTGTAKSTPLFMKKVDGIIKCLKRNGVRFSGSWSEDEEAFRICCERMHGLTRGRRMTASRFAAGLQKALECTAWWEVDSLEREYLALESRQDQADC